MEGGSINTFLQFDSSQRILWLIEENGFNALIENGAKITIHRLSDSDLDERNLASFLMGWALPIAAIQRGITPLHAAAVAKGHEAILVGGQSGMGKSTLACALSRRPGWQLLGDDIAPVDASDSSLTVFPTYPRFKLFPNSLTRLGLEWESLERVDPSVDKRYLPVNGDEFCAEPRELRRIYLLANAQSASSAARLRVLPQKDQFRELQAHFRFGYRRFRHVWPWLFESLTRIVAEAPVRILERPRDEVEPDQLAELIENDLQENG